MPSTSGETRHGVALTNLDAALFDGADATKRDLVDYLEAVHAQLIPELTDRPLSVMRVHRGSDAFMQKNLPGSAPDWIDTATIWAETSRRDVRYALCNDLPTLIWFANQRAVEYHPMLVRVSEPSRPTHMVIDLDPPEGAAFATVVRAAHLVRDVLRRCGLDGAVKTSGAKGVHVFVPTADGSSFADCAAATRAIAARAEQLDPSLLTTEFVKDRRGGRVYVDPTRVGGATVAAPFSPRLRPGVPVSFPVSWSEIDAVDPKDFTLHTAPALLATRTSWRDEMPAPVPLPPDLVEQGRTIPPPRVQAMHEGRRRKRAQND